MDTPTATERPLRKDAERNRRRILEAARDLFAARGLEPHLNDVAHHAGVGVGTIYRRFPTKEDLFESLFEDALNHMTDLAEEALRQPDSWDGFAWYVEQMCAMTATDRGLREIAFSKAYGGARVKAAQDRLDPAVAKLVERAKRDGYLRPDLSRTDMPILALLSGTVTEFAGHVGDDLWRRYVWLLLDGMRKRDDDLPLPVPALDNAELDTAKRTWEPAGPGGGRMNPPAATQVRAAPK